MAAGGGKYATECQVALEATGASVCVVIVIRGSKGSGFSCSVDPMKDGLTDAIRLPDVLREIADQMERDLRGTNN